MSYETTSYNPFAELIDTSSVLPTTQTFRQPPKKRISQGDQLDSFRIHDKLNSLDDLNQSHSPPRFEFRQFEGCVIFYRLRFDSVSQFPTILESIRIDEELHVQLQYNGIHFHHRHGSLTVTAQS